MTLTVTLLVLANRVIQRLVLNKQRLIVLPLQTMTCLLPDKQHLWLVLTAMLKVALYAFQTGTLKLCNQFTPWKGQVCTFQHIGVSSCSQGRSGARQVLNSLGTSLAHGKMG